MADARPPSPRPGMWRRFLNRPNTDGVKTIGMSLLVAIGCGFTVSIAAVVLRPIQQANIVAQQQGRMVQMLENVPHRGDIEGIWRKRRRNARHRPRKRNGRRRCRSGKLRSASGGGGRRAKFGPAAR